MVCSLRWGPWARPVGLDVTEHGSPGQFSSVQFSPLADGSVYESVGKVLKFAVAAAHRIDVDGGSVNCIWACHQRIRMCDGLGVFPHEVSAHGSYCITQGFRSWIMFFYIWLPVMYDAVLHGPSGHGACSSTYGFR